MRIRNENDRPRLDADIRDALHQIRQRFAKTLALGLTSEEWKTLQRGEIPADTEAREVIRQTAEEAEGETLELMAHIWDRIVDATPQQEAQAQDWMRQQTALGTYADRFGDVAWEAGSPLDEPKLTDRDQNQSFLQSELSLAQAEAMGVKVACYGIPVLNFLPGTGNLMQIIRAGKIVVEVVNTVITTINAVKFARDHAQTHEEMSAVASVPPEDPDSDGDEEGGDEVESAEVPEGDLYNGFPEGRSRGGLFNELKRRRERAPSGWERHHLISRAACKKVGMRDLKDRGPAVWVRIGHHCKTASHIQYKSGMARKMGEKFIAKQTELLKQGKVREALAMGIKDLQSVESGYNGGIKLAMKAAQEAGFLGKGMPMGVGGRIASGAIGTAAVGSAVMEGAAPVTHSDSRGGDHADRGNDHSFGSSRGSSLGHDRSASEHASAAHEHRDRELTRESHSSGADHREYHEHREGYREIDTGLRDGMRERVHEVREVHVDAHNYHETVTREHSDGSRSGHEIHLSDRTSARDTGYDAARAGESHSNGGNSGGGNSGNQGSGNHGAGHHDHHSHHGGNHGGRSGSGGGDCNVM
jgi:hypothetical protein